MLNRFCVQSPAITNHMDFQNWLILYNFGDYLHHPSYTCFITRAILPTSPGLYFIHHPGHISYITRVIFPTSTGPYDTSYFTRAILPTSPGPYFACKIHSYYNFTYTSYSLHLSHVTFFNVSFRYPYLRPNNLNPELI
jgi:hypothetical protein